MNYTSTNGSSTDGQQGCQVNGSSIPWAEIFSRHEAVLVSHREMLDSVKDHIAQDGESFRAVSTMLNKTVQAMNQFQIVRKQMLNQMPNKPNPTNESTEPTPNSRSQNTESRRKKKRSRIEDQDMAHNTDLPSETPVSKRKANPAPPSETTGESRNISPFAYDTEDISAEVQRRLRIKEERRRKKENAQPEKRKRESLLSNESMSPGGFKPSKKRARVGDGLSSGLQNNSRAKRQKQ